MFSLFFTVHSVHTQAIPKMFVGVLTKACVLAFCISVSLDYSWASPFLCLQSSFVIVGYMRNNVYSKAAQSRSNLLLSVKVSHKHNLYETLSWWNIWFLNLDHCFSRQFTNSQTETLMILIFTGLFWSNKSKKVQKKPLFTVTLFVL